MHDSKPSIVEVKRQKKRVSHRGARKAAVCLEEFTDLRIVVSCLDGRLVSQMSSLGQGGTTEGVITIATAQSPAVTP